MKMTFGKYKGVELEDIPEDYLVWCLENCAMHFTLTEEMENQLRLKGGKGVIRDKKELY